MDKADFKKGWKGGLPETPCGYGSKIGATGTQRRALESLIKFYGFRSIVDIGAGDLNWIKKVEMPGIEYTPLDLVPRHEDVTQFDVVTTVPPAADLAMCLWVLNHLPEAAGQRALGNILVSGCKYLLMTWEKRLPEYLNMPFIQEWTIRKRADPEKGDCYLRLHRLRADIVEAA